MSPVDICTSVDIFGDPVEIFKYVVPVELSLIFKKKGIIPAVRSTSNIELWYKPGMERMVTFEDGSTAKEKLTRVIEPESFAYTITDFTSPLRFLIKKIEGEWTFIINNRNGVTIKWMYSLYPKNIFTRIVITIVIKNTIRGVLNNALGILKTTYEKN